MGRVAATNRHGGVASAYDCCTCSCPLPYGALTVSPAGGYLLPGQQCQMAAYERVPNYNTDVLSLLECGHFDAARASCPR